MKSQNFALSFCPDRSLKLKVTLRVYMVGFALLFLFFQSKSNVEICVFLAEKFTFHIFSVIYGLLERSISIRDKHLKSGPGIRNCDKSDQ